MTSSTRSGPTTPAVSSSTPRPSRLGFWAMVASSRPSRFRCWKCWSTMTPGQQPEARGHLDHPLLGRAAAGARTRPCGCSWREAPALVPATTEPWRWRSRIACAIGGATDRGREAQLVAAGHEHAGRCPPRCGRSPRRSPGRASWRGSATPRPRPAPGRRAWYVSPAIGPSDEALLMTAMRASGPPASATKRLRMRRSRTLSSAPPMTMTCPSAMRIPAAVRRSASVLDGAGHAAPPLMRAPRPRDGAVAPSPRTMRAHDRPTPDPVPAPTIAARPAPGRAAHRRRDPRDPGGGRAGPVAAGRPELGAPTDCARVTAPARRSSPGVSAPTWPGSGISSTGTRSRSGRTRRVRRTSSAPLVSARRGCGRIASARAAGGSDTSHGR